MKFTLKTLVAALALSAATAPAQAAMSTVASGDSSMILTLLDFNNTLSATFDLGYTYSQFTNLVTDANNNGGSFSWNLTTGDYASAWSSFAAVANLANTKWAVFAGDNTGTGVGTRGIISTYQSGNKLTATTQLQTALSNFNGYIVANNPLGTHATANDGASFVNSLTGFAGAATAYGSTGRINAAGYVAMGALDSALNVVSELSGSGAAAPTIFTTLGNEFGNYQFAMSSAGALTFTTAVTPVPEADAYTMMMIGLGLVGFVVRRRTQ